MANRGIALSTAGVTISYAMEETLNTRPTSGYVAIPDIKEVPDFNPEPETHEATDLEETEYKFYVAGLKDVGGALSFLANFTSKLQEEWEGIVAKYNAGVTGEAQKRMWFQIKHPKLPKAVFFTGEPASMGLPQMSVNGILETNVYITPTSSPEWQTKTED